MIFRKAPWTAEIATRLVRATLYPDDLRSIASEVVKGISELWEVNGGESYLVTRVEHADLVVVMYEGSNVLEMAKYCLKAANLKSLPYVRFHTSSEALIRKLRALSPEPIEYVMRVQAYGQQKRSEHISESADNKRSGY